MTLFMIFYLRSEEIVRQIGDTIAIRNKHKTETETCSPSGAER